MKKETKYENVVLEIKKIWKKFFESLFIMIICLVLVYYLFIVRENKNILDLKKLWFVIVLYLMAYAVTFIKLYIQKSKLKNQSSNLNLDEINENFYVSIYESYNNLKNKLKHYLKKSLIVIIILSIILGFIYFNVDKNKKYNSDSWYTEWAKLDHYDNPKYKNQKYSTGYFYYIGKDGKTYEYTRQIKKIEKDIFIKTNEYKELIYVSETDNSKSMKYENYSTKYEIVNNYVSPIIFGIIIILLMKIILLTLRLIILRKYIK